MHLINRFFIICASTMLLASCVHVKVSTDKLMTPDDPPALSHLPAGYVVASELLRSTEGNSVSATYAHRPGNKIVLVFFGGDGFHIALEGGEVLRTFAAFNVDIVMFDYPGHGGSSGAQSIQAVHDAALTVYDRLNTLDWVQSQRRVLYGFSMGGFIAPHIAQVRKVDGIVLEATAPSVDAWAKSMIPWYAEWLVRVDIDPPLAALNTPVALEKFPGKVLVLASKKDQQAPPQLSRQLCASLTRQNVQATCHIFEKAPHGKVTEAPTYPAIVGGFLSDLGITR